MYSWVGCSNEAGTLITAEFRRDYSPKPAPLLPMQQFMGFAGGAVKSPDFHLQFDGNLRECVLFFRGPEDCV